MKLNWTTFRVVLALVVVIGTIFWAVSSVRTLSYSGTNLNIDVGGGPVTVLNPSSEPIPVQLVGAGTSSFRVSSTIADVSGENVSGASTRQGSGRTSTQLFEFVLPPGASEFTVVRGSDVNLIANTDTNLVATVHPMNDMSTRTTLIAAAVIVLGAFYYISRTTGHGWINALRGKPSDIPVVTPIAAVAVAGGQGDAIRSYGDNRTDISH